MEWTPTVPDALRDPWRTIVRRAAERAVRAAAIVMADVGPDEPSQPSLERLEERIARARSEGR